MNQNITSPTLQAFDRNIGGGGAQAIDARLLHSELGSRRDFSNWIQDQIAKRGFENGRHFTTFESAAQQKWRAGKRGLRIEYTLTAKAAAEIAAGHNSPQGRKMLRRLLSELERAKAPAVAPALDLSNPKQLLQLLTQTSETAAGLQATLEEQSPKVRFFDAVADASGAQSIAEVAKVLGTGRTRLFAFLRDSGVLLEDNLPRQRHVDEGHFLVRQRVYTDASGESHTYSRTLVTGKGVVYIQRKLAGKQSTSHEAH